MLTKALTSLTGFTVGDILAQKVLRPFPSRIQCEAFLSPTLQLPTQHIRCFSFFFHLRSMHHPSTPPCSLFFLRKRGDVVHSPFLRIPCIVTVPLPAAPAWPPVLRCALSQFVEKKEKYDVMRTVRLGSFGFLIHGTTGHYFYGFLDSQLPGTKPITVATKVRQALPRRSETGRGSRRRDRP